MNHIDLKNETAKTIQKQYKALHQDPRLELKTLNFILRQLKFENSCRKMLNAKRIMVKNNEKQAEGTKVFWPHRMSP